MRRFLWLHAAVLIPTCACAQLEPGLPAPVDDALSVITPTRLRQSLADVPASVTVLTSAMLERYGITSVVDALRLVPGMQITQPSGTDVRVNYHGTNGLVPRRMNVLVDGMSVYRPAFSRVYWKQLPVAMEDIDRIEVTRGPNSATYGPNSMLAIVNIITKHPKDVARGLVSAAIGSNGMHNVTGRFSATVADTALRLTVNQDRDEGYDFLSRIGQGHDTTKMSRLNVRTATQLSPDARVEFHGAYVNGVSEVPFADAYQATFPDQKVRDHSLGTVFTLDSAPTHELKVSVNHSKASIRQRWVTCPPAATLLPELFTLWRANPGYVNMILAGQAPSGGTATDDMLAGAALAAIAGLGAGALSPICGTANQDESETRTDIEVQSTLVVNPQVRTVAGLGVRHQRGVSQTFLNGSASNVLYRAFANVEYRPRPWLNVNVGGYAEHDRLNHGSTFSPRAALNIHLSDRQTVRLVASSGTRTPDIQEQRTNWSYAFNDLNPALNGSTSGRFYQSAISPGNLRNEKIVSREIGYLLNANTLGLLLDVRVFDDELTDLVSEKLQVASFSPTNSGRVDLRGVEVQAHMDFSTDWNAFLSYAYLESRNASSVLEQTQYARHSAGLGVSHAFGHGWRASLSYYGASGDGAGETPYGRTDLVVSRAFLHAGRRCTASLGLSRLDNKSASYFRDVGSAPESLYDNRLHVRAQLKVAF